MAQNSTPPLTLLSKLLFATTLLFLSNTSPLAAAENTSYLKSVAITDAAGANAPPTAVISYTKQGNVYTFNASQSSDSDGTIVSYNWKFSDGSTYEGRICSHALPTDASITGQLTLADNSGGVTLTPIQMSSTILKDTFSEAVLTPLTNHKPEIGGTWHILNSSQQLVVATGNYMKNSSSDGTLFYNDASPGSANYSVRAHILINNTNYDRIAGPCLRLTSQGNGYCGYLTGKGEFVLSKHVSGSIYGTKLASKMSNTQPSTTGYIIELKASEATLVAILKNENGDVLDSLTSNDSSYLNEGFAGGVIRRNNSLIYSIEGGH